MKLKVDAELFEGSGFEFEASFSDTNIVEVVGRNGVGKTRIARSILWALGSEHPIVQGTEEDATVGVGIRRQTDAEIVNEGTKPDKITQLITKNTKKGRIYQKNSTLYTPGYDPAVVSLIFMPELFFSMGANEVREALSRCRPQIDLNAEYERVFGKKYPEKLTIETVSVEHKKLNKARLDGEKLVASLEGEAKGLIDSLPEKQDYDEDAHRELQIKIKKMEQVNAEGAAWKAWEQANIKTIARKRELEKLVQGVDREGIFAREKEYVDLQSSRSELEKKLDSLKIEGRNLNEKLSKFSSNKCPTCGHQADLSSQKSEIENKLVELRKEYASEATSLQSLESKIKSFTDKEQTEKFIEAFNELDNTFIAHEPSKPPRTYSGELEQAKEQERVFSSLRMRVSEITQKQKKLEMTKVLLEKKRAEVAAIAELEANLHPKKGLLGKLAQDSTDTLGMPSFDIELEKTDLALHHGIQRDPLDVGSDACGDMAAQLARNVIRQLGLIGRPTRRFVQSHVEHPDVGSVRDTPEGLVIGR